MTDPLALLGFDVGGTKTAVILGTSDGAILARQQVASPLHLGPAAMIDVMAIWRGRCWRTIQRSMSGRLEYRSAGT